MSPANKLNVAIAISSFFPDVGGAQITAHNLARKMEQLQSSPELRTKLSANGRSTVRHSFSWAVVGKQFEDLYHSLLSNPSSK